MRVTIIEKQTATLNPSKTLLLQQEERAINTRCHWYSCDKTVLVIVLARKTAARPRRFYGIIVCVSYHVW